MSDQVAIRIRNVGKMYKMFQTRLDNFLNASGLDRLTPWRQIKFLEFWALRDINLEVKKCCRLGIIGRNGAGKSTLLKLITCNITPTEGEIYVNGEVQALLTAGAGFHPEFTGYENVRASLVYQGLSDQQNEAAIQDIVEFTELGNFFGQPFKTYSSGMQARLAFATATVLKPDILIVDEILGAGDAYFSVKSAERMKKLVEDSGATVLLVSHALDQILRYCDECIWIERGRVIMHGATLEIVRAYEEFIHKLEDRRLKAKNVKRQSDNYDPTRINGFGDTLSICFLLKGGIGTRCDISEVTLLRNGRVEETLKVGDVQDTSWSHAAVLELDGSEWTEPMRTKYGYHRSLVVKNGASGFALGYAVINTYALFEDADYGLKIRYRCPPSGQLSLKILRKGSEFQKEVELPSSDRGWLQKSFPVKLCASKLSSQLSTNRSRKITSLPIQQEQPFENASPPITRWPGQGSLMIEKVLILGPHDFEQTVFPVGTPITLSLTYRAHSEGAFSVIFVAVLFRVDGIVISQNISPPAELTLKKGDVREARLNFHSINLGNGRYVFSVALYRKLDPCLLEEPEKYDLIDRSFEFEIVGNRPLRSGIVELPADWSLS